MPIQADSVIESNRARRRQLSLRTWAIAVAFAVTLGSVAILFFNTAKEIAEASPRNSASSRMKQILVALHNYHDTYGCFPPAVVSDKQGRPLYSGRVLLLPFLEQDRLYRNFDRTQAWNSPRNIAVSSTIVRAFNDPRSRNAPSARTEFLFVTGPSTIFEPDTRLSFDAVTDELSQTACVLHLPNSDVQWAEPRDLDIRTVYKFQPSDSRDVAVVGFVDGHVSTVPCDTPRALVHAMLTRNGGESVLIPPD